MLGVRPCFFSRLWLDLCFVLFGAAEPFAESLFAAAFLGRLVGLAAFLRAIFFALDFFEFVWEFLLDFFLVAIRAV